MKIAELTITSPAAADTIMKVNDRPTGSEVSAIETDGSVVSKVRVVLRVEIDNFKLSEDLID